MDYKTRVTVFIFFLIPELALANEEFISLQSAIFVLLLQLIPFIHILWSRQLASCYKTGYCMLYLSLLAISWLLAALTAAWLPDVPRIFLRLPLLLPILFWIYTFTLGKDVRDSEKRTCQVSPKSTDIEQQK